MVLEGQTPIWEGTKREYSDIEKKLIIAKYRDHPTLRFQKPGEIKTFVKDLPENRWCHVQVVEKENKILIFAHTEPSAEADPLGHLDSAFGERANFGAGAKIVRADLRATRVYMDSRYYTESIAKGRQPIIGSCTICGRSIWSPISMKRGIGSWCYKNRR